VTAAAATVPAEGAALATAAADPKATDIPANETPYILQAGAFGASGDAEAIKAKIALLGLSARVESARIHERTVYRVRMGPYATASELADAKRKLAGGGLPAMAIKAK
jgi:cell division protein FtsN